MTEPMTLEQQARDMLDRAGVPDAQSMTSGHLVEIANLLSERNTLTAERNAARAEFSEWLDASRKALDAHAEVVAERDAAREDFDRLAAQHAEYVAGKATLKDVSFRDGETRLAIGTEMAAIMGDSLAQMLDEGGAENYVECELYASDRKGYCMTVRRMERPSPHDLRRAAEADRDRLAACVERVRGCDRYVFDGYDTWLENDPVVVTHSDNGPWYRAADILAALEGTNG